MDISDEELLTDIEFTEKEADAYYNIATGFMVLSGLPENAGESIYFMNAKKYYAKEKDCKTFLDFLLKMKSKRGL